MSKKPLYAARFADTVALLCKEPRSVPRLHQLTGMSKSTLREHVRALQDEGLIVPGWGEQGQFGRPRMIWVWTGHRLSESRDPA